MPSVSVRVKNSDPLAIFHSPVRDWFTGTFTAATRPLLACGGVLADGGTYIIVGAPGGGLIGPLRLAVKAVALAPLTVTVAGNVPTTEPTFPPVALATSR